MLGAVVTELWYFCCARQGERKLEAGSGGMKGAGGVDGDGKGVRLVDRVGVGGVVRGEGGAFSVANADTAGPLQQHQGSRDH